METTSGSSRSERVEKISSWPLMSSFAPLLAIFVAYLLIIYKLLPKLMATRKPFNISAIIQVYNVFQVLVCTASVIKYFQYGFRLSHVWQCIDGSSLYSEKIDDLHWYLLLLRTFEFVETVFFSLRKRFNQVSFLHVYHHMSTVVMLWINMKFSDTRMEVFIGVINSSVHVVMYGYYFFSSIEKFKKVTAKLKMCITSLQIVQLVSILGHCLVAVQPDCKSNHGVFFLQSLNISLLIVLFANFYVRSFLLSRKGEKAN